MKYSKLHIIGIIIGAAFLMLTMLFNHSIPTFLSHQDDIDPINIASQYDPNDTTAIFNNESVSVPKYLSRTQLESNVLGITTPEDPYPYEEKKIFVDLANQRLYAFQGDSLVYNFLISSGKWGRTPTGTFRIWVKLRSVLMSGGSQALGTYYYLPNVPYTMFFYNNAVPKERGYGIHGTYWHDNFGHPMSHGCINMKTEEVEQLFYWANPEDNGAHTTYSSPDDLGTEITIFGEAPQS